MKVALDGRAFDSPAGGVRRYVNELFAAVARVAPEVTVTAIGGRSATSAMSHRAGGPSLPTNLGWCATGLPLAARSVEFDVFHAPAYTAPLWGVRPLVITIHDVSYARHPEWSPHPGGIGPIRQWFYRTSALRATRVITDSEFSASEITAAYSIPADRIDVVPLGVSPRFHQDLTVPRERCVLHVGDIHPRRHLGLLLEAVLAVRRRHPDSKLRLVLAGRDLGSLAGLQSQAAASGAADVLDYVGTPPDDDLALWYRRAAVFGYPSRYEGFGLPVLEAMASGTPVVAARAASIPEVTGDAAMLIDPIDDARPWVDAIEAVLVGGERARDLSARGIDQARSFTWDRAAERTLESYRRAVTMPGAPRL